MIHTVLQGDVFKALAAMPSGVVQTVITSPPYWGLRDYSQCDCTPRGSPPDPACPRCRGTGKLIGVVENQIGLEPTPGEYVEKLVRVFREVRRVLRDDGTVWLNLGDCYASGGGFGRQGKTGLKSKDLVGMPWRVAFALQGQVMIPAGEIAELCEAIQTDNKDYLLKFEAAYRFWAEMAKMGWYLRMDIIWAKPNPIPESVVDRPTKAHEYLFLLAKKERYFYDGEAIKEMGVIPAGTLAAKGSEERRAVPGVNARPPEYKEYDGLRNKRSVWTITTQAFHEAHFATFPEELVEPCIKAGTSARGACPICGSPWRRVVEVVDPEGRLGTGYNDHVDDLVQGQRGVFSGEGRPQKITIGWEPSCECRSLKKQDALGKATYTGFNDRYKESLGKERTERWEAPECGHDLEPVPCVVLDIFGGSGTVALVSRRLGRSSVSIELNPEYVGMIKRRLGLDGQQKQLTEDLNIQYEVRVVE